MSFHPNEIQEQSSRSSDRPEELVASIATASWTRPEMQPGRNPTPELPAFLDFGNQAALYGKDSLRFSDRSLLAQATDQQHPKDTAETDKPIASGAELIKTAEKLGHDPHRWAQTKESPAPKCNQYVEAVLQAGHIPLPWQAGHADCHGMRVALDKECAKPDSMWEKVYAYDDKHGQQSDLHFTQYQPKNGDVMIWDGMWGNDYVQHSGITAKPYDILYAGSQSYKAPHGWARGSITNFTRSQDNYGSPTAVYRYKKPSN